MAAHQTIPEQAPVACSLTPAGLTDRPAAGSGSPPGP